MGKAAINTDLIKHYLDNYTISAITYNGNAIKTLTIDGIVLWDSESPAILDVAKITSDTYAGETTYTNESFILLDIYPKAANSYVKVTYGDLTKELTFTGTNAQQVFFGTFNGVSDDVATPSSGTLTIEGEFIGFGVGSYSKSSKSSSTYCSCITSIVNMSNITTIPDNAFNGCESLTSVVIPNSVTSVGATAFNMCTSIADVYYKGSLKRWLNISFNNGSSNPMYHGANLYFNNKLVTEVVVPNSTMSIGTATFAGCNSLTIIDIPSSVTSIGDYAFYGCKSLTSVEIPDSVTSIGDYAFIGCRSLTSIIIPDSVTSIGDWTFSQCTSLTSVVISNSVTSIGSLAFALCESLADVVIGNSVTNIGYMAFSTCTSLTNVVMPNSVTSIESRAFEDCNRLEISEFHEGLTYIGEDAFIAEDAEPYDMLTLPASLQELGQNSFAYQSGDYTYSRVKNIKMCGSTPPVMGYSIDSSNDELSVGAFGSKSNADLSIISITVPKGSGEAYKTADGWSLYASKIVEEQ